MDKIYYSQIKQFAEQYAMPASKDRGIVREFLQAKFISHLYEHPNSPRLSFVGGTSLRLLRDLPRFSEDLDFDNLGLGDAAILEIIESVIDRFTREGIQIELKTSLLEGKTYYEVKFPDLLYKLDISTNPREKLMLKVDYSGMWQSQVTEVRLLSRYGYVAHVVTNSIDQLLVQKLTAYVKRRQTQARDLFDVVWLYSQGAKLDKDFMEANSLMDILDLAKQKYAQEGVGKQLKERIRPFIFIESELGKLELFGSVLNSL